MPRRLGIPRTVTSSLALDPSRKNEENQERCRKGVGIVGGIHREELWVRWQSFQGRLPPWKGEAASTECPGRPELEFLVSRLESSGCSGQQGVYKSPLRIC